MTIVRYQIHCLASKNDAVIIVIEDDCDFTTFHKRGLRTLITPNVIWIKIRFPLFVVTCPYTTFRPWCCSATLFATTASTFVELTIGNCSANHGGQTCPNTQNRSSTRAPQSCSKTDLPNSLCMLSSSENIQSPSSAHPIVFT